MMSADSNVPRRQKTSERNLYLVGDIYYYRRGDYEESLGRFPNEQKAIDYKRAYEAKRDTIGVRAYKFRVKDIWPDYFKERQSQLDGEISGREMIRQRTFDEIKGTWERHLRKFFAMKRLSEIDDPLWAQYVKKARVGDLTNHRKVFKTFLKWCKLNGYVRHIPELEVPKVKRRSRRILKPNEIKSLLAHCEGNLLTFVSMYLFMGVRWGEQVRLKWTSVDMQHQFLKVLEETSRTKRARAVPINSFVFELLKRRKSEQKAKGLSTPWVYPMRGRPAEHMSVTGVVNPWRRALAKAGLENVTPHDLRATYEYYANKRSDFTDTQREKMAGAAIEVQRRLYVSFDADDIRGLEEVVQFEGLDEVLAMKAENGKMKNNTGRTRD